MCGQGSFNSNYESKKARCGIVHTGGYTSRFMISTVRIHTNPNRLLRLYPIFVKLVGDFDGCQHHSLRVNTQVYMMGIRPITSLGHHQNLLR